MTAHLQVVRDGDQADDVEYLTSPQVCALAGITYRQLDFWARTGYLDDTAKGSGSRRDLTWDDVRLLRLVSSLRRFDVALPRAFELARALVADGDFNTNVGDVEITIRPLPMPDVSAGTEPTVTTEMETQDDRSSE